MQTAIRFNSPEQARSLTNSSTSAAKGTVARDALRKRFEDRLVVREHLNRRLVSYQANKAEPGLRWFRYKEGFSADFVQDALGSADGPVLYPFAGIGTTVLVAGGGRRHATGIEIMPVGARAAKAISCVANVFALDRFEQATAKLRALAGKEADPSFYFPHVRITEQAFPAETEAAIAKARAFLAQLEDQRIRAVLDVACMSVLEEASYTRKDGQYLRWDHRCGRALRGGMDKGLIPSYAEALERRLREIVQ